MIHCPWWTEPKRREPEISQCLEASTSLCHISSLKCSSKDVNVSVHFILRSSFCFFLRLKLHFFEVAAFTSCNTSLLKVLINMELNEIPFSLCFSLALCFDHTIPWHIHRQIFNSYRSGPSLIGAMRNKSKQETGLVPNRVYNALKTPNVSCDCPVSLHVTSCNIFPILPQLMYGC